MSEETIPQMRERIATLEKEIKTLESAKTELSSENRTLKAREVFRTEGYDPNHGDLFATANKEGDITPEAVNEFATRFNLKPQPKTPEQTEEGDPSVPSEEEPGTSTSNQALAAMAGGGSGAGGGGQQPLGTNTLTREQYNALAKENPAAARQAVSEGRVQLRGDNPLAVKR